MSDWKINEYGYASRGRGVAASICDGDLYVEYTYPVDTGEFVDASLSIPVHVIRALMTASDPAQKAAADVILAARHVVEAQTRSSIDEDHQLCVLANALATFDALNAPTATRSVMTAEEAKAWNDWNAGTRATAGKGGGK